MSSLFLFLKSIVRCRTARFRINEVNINSKKSVPNNEISEFKGVGLTGVGLTRVDCTLLLHYNALNT